eukprot:356223-Chlamydomonas_euryale.AAC.1
MFGTTGVKSRPSLELSSQRIMLRTTGVKSRKSNSQPFRVGRTSLRAATCKVAKAYSFAFARVKPQLRLVGAMHALQCMST